jgi:cytochrome o ubiquinol oxidase operon protein cyoD
MHDHPSDGSHEEKQFALRPYLIGFVLCAALTLIPFWIVMSGSIASTNVASAAIVVLAVAQILVQTFTFLHVNARAQGGWTLIAYVFTAVMLVITISGSVWIMYHMNANMMPGMIDHAVMPAP